MEIMFAEGIFFIKNNLQTLFALTFAFILAHSVNEWIWKSFQNYLSKKKNIQKKVQIKEKHDKKWGRNLSLAED